MQGIDVDQDPHSAKLHGCGFLHRVDGRAVAEGSQHHLPSLRGRPEWSLLRSGYRLNVWEVLRVGL